MVYVQEVVGKKNFLFQLEDGQKREVGYFLIVYVCSEEDFGHQVNQPIYDLPKKEGEFFTIDGNPVDEG